MKRTIPFVLALMLAATACADDTETGDTEAPATGGTSAPEPTPAPSTEAPATAAPTTAAAADPFDLTFDAGGLALEGRAYPAGSTWVVLGHMLPADMTSWMPFAERLHEEGFGALVYNNQGYGNSEGTRADLDVSVAALAAINTARELGAERVFFFGASMNGAAALWVAAEEELAGIATLSAVRFFPPATDAIGAAPRVTEPALFVAAEDDPPAPDDAAAFAEAVPGGGELIIYTTGGHGTDMFEDHPDLEESLLDFVRRHS